MEYDKINNEVLYSTNDITKINISDIEVLKERASLNRRRRIRLCVHKSINDNIHEMLIVHGKSCYVRPHKHLNKVESFHIIEGSANIILFNDVGVISQVIEMGDFSTGKNFFYRLPPSHYHTIIIKSDVLVFHETTNGPFRPDETIWADWAPDESDDKKILQYIKKLNEKIKQEYTT